MTNSKLQFYNTCVTWTRSIVLILSIFIVVLSLCIYNNNAIPLFSLISIQEDESNPSEAVKKLIFSMIGDRKLIATLVAAQASIFCPVFLLLSKADATSKICTSLHHRYCRSTPGEITKTVIEQFCQFLMPLGLALSWIFCIMFEKKIEAALFSQQQSASDVIEEQPSQQEEELFYRMLLAANEKQENGVLGWELAAYLVCSLKYVIIGVLVVEVLAIWASSFKYTTILIDKHQQQAIRLEEEEDDDRCIYYPVDCCVDQKSEQEEEEKILYNI